MKESSETTHVPLDASTRLAVDRNRLALDRTLMAWIRTAISLITFGYAVYKVVAMVRPDPSAQPPLIGHREFGLIMIGIGLVSLVLGVWEHRRYTAQLEADFRVTAGRLSNVRLMAGLVAVLGLIAFLTMVFRQ